MHTPTFGRYESFMHVVSLVLASALLALALLASLPSLVAAHGCRELEVRASTQACAE